MAQVLVSQFIHLAAILINLCDLLELFIDVVSIDNHVIFL